MTYQKQLKHMIKRYCDNNEGATAIIYAITLPVLIGFFALSVELGHYQQRNAQIQASADMAALAAVMEYNLTGDRDKALLAARGDALENGYVIQDGALTVESPITSGEFAGNEGAIVRLEQNQERYFSQIFPIKGEVTHVVEATVLGKKSGKPVCVLTLSSTASPALSITGSTDVNIQQCGLHSNSTASPSVSNTGAGSLTAECVSASGGIGTMAGTTFTDPDCPTAKANRPAIIDPYLDIDVPANVAAMPCLTPNFANGGMELVPGRYCGKDLAPRGLTTFVSPGVYIFDGIGIFARAKASMVGDGVTLIFMNGGHLDNSNGGQMTLTAPTTGPYAGILMYSDRNTSNPSLNFLFNGNQSAKLEGVLYFPTQRVDFRGGANLNSVCTNIVADTVVFSGNSALTNSGCETAGARPISAGGTNTITLVQ